MLKARDIHMEILSSIFILLLVVLAVFNKNRIDYIYLGFIFILIFKNFIERFRK
jgi:TRAP-type C4-dicarboxylate transport system permease large subunit